MLKSHELAEGYAGGCKWYNQNIGPTTKLMSGFILVDKVKEGEKRQEIMF